MIFDCTQEEEAVEEAEEEVEDEVAGRAGS